MPSKKPSPISDRPPLTDGDLDAICRAFGTFVEQCREERKLKRRPAAKLAGLSVKHLADVEDGANPTLKIIARLAHAYDLRSIDLAGATLGLPSGELRTAIETLSHTVEQIRSSAFGKENAATEAVSLPEPVSVPAAGGEKSGQADGLPRELRVSAHKPELARLRVGGQIADGRFVSASGSDVLMLPHDAAGGASVEVVVEDDSLLYAGVGKGDRLIVEQGVEIHENALVVAILNGKVLIGRYRVEGPNRILALGASQPEITVGEGEDFSIYGVLRSIVRTFE